jgi:hypothetical protein
MVLEPVDTVPLFHLLLSSESRQHVFVQFVIYETVNAVFLCEPVDYISFVLSDSFAKVACDSDINGAISFAGENINRRLLMRHQHAGFPLSRE